MNIYKIEHKILTLAECAFFDETGKPEVQLRKNTGRE